MTDTPIHTAILAGRPVRLYRSPLDGPDWPWAALADVLAVAGFNAEGADYWATRWREVYPTLIRDLSDGTAIAPDVAAMGLFELAADAGWPEAAGLLERYREAATLVFCAVNVQFSGSELVALARQAGLRNMPVIPGITLAN